MLSKYRQAHPIEYEQHECEACGESFRRHKRKNAAKYCRASCRRKSHLKTCASCGKGFRGVKAQAYCSQKCKGIASRVDRQYVCGWCGKEFEPKAKSRQCCSLRCRSLALRNAEHKSLAARQSFRKIVSFRSRIRFCLMCGWPFLANTKGQTCGKRECLLENGRRRAGIERAERRAKRGKLFCVDCGKEYDHTTQGQRQYCRSCSALSWQRAKDRRRARIARVEYEVFSREAVFIRDEWRCGICGKPTEPDKLVPHLLAPTLDHIVPIRAAHQAESYPSPNRSNLTKRLPCC